MTVAQVDVRTSPPYRVHVGPGALGQLARELGSDRMILSDERVAALHRGRLKGLEEAPLVLVPRGEQAKRMAVLERVLEDMARAGLDRGSALATFGGGAIGDLGGLAASLYMRGIAVVHAPTTLLAQVDASVGGKTAVNLEPGKNLAGTFHQPRAVVTDTEVLATLDGDDFQSGLGEAVKSAMVGSDELFELMERETKAIVARDPDLLAQVVQMCVRIKASVVEEDEREAGPRRKLNLGHTFAHAIERAAGYGRVPHGIAVGTGLCLALECSRRLGLLYDQELPARVSSLLERLGLSPGLADLCERFAVSLDAASLFEGMRHDKKGRAGEPALVVPRAIGDLATGVLPPREVLLAAIDKNAGV